MKNVLIQCLVIALTYALSGCASSYRPIRPANLQYNNHQDYGGLGVAYKYEVLRERGNKKYAKKEDKSSVKVVAVELINTTKRTIYGKDIVFYSGTQQLYPLSPLETKNSIRQIVPSHLLYLLLSLVTVNVYDAYGRVEVYPVGLIIGPGLAIGNMAVAGSANKKLLAELTKYDIQTMEIPPGERYCALLGIASLDYNPIRVRLKSNVAADAIDN